jgi:hypothetical protein
MYVEQRKLGAYTWLDIWEDLVEIFVPDPQPAPEPSPNNNKRNFADGGDCKGLRVQA